MAIVVPAFVRRWAGPALLTSVALAQWAEVEATGLTRWKGGGYGMYSEHHPTDYEVWLRLEGEGREPEFEYLDANELETLGGHSARCLQFHDETCLSALGREIEGVTTPFSVQLWVYESDGLRFRRRLEAEVEIR